MKPLSESQPHCHRCKKPMSLHAVEVISENSQTDDVTATMEIFHCDSCGQLSAREQVEAA